MRLWHKCLIKYLPDKQLISQWRECCAIASRIEKNGTPNHILVNKILKYPQDEFNTYTDFVISEMRERGFKCDPWNFYRHRNDINNNLLSTIFKGWHTKEYLRQNLSNLMEKWQCGGISDTEWYRLCYGYKQATGEDYTL